jgi:hypothetical protein
MEHLDWFTLSVLVYLVDLMICFLYTSMYVNNVILSSKTTMGISGTLKICLHVPRIMIYHSWSSPSVEVTINSNKKQASIQVRLYVRKDYGICDITVIVSHSWVILHFNPFERTYSCSVNREKYKSMSKHTTPLSQVK